MLLNAIPHNQEGSGEGLQGHHGHLVDLKLIEFKKKKKFMYLGVLKPFVSQAQLTDYCGQCRSRQWTWPDFGSIQSNLGFDNRLEIGISLI